MDLGRVSRQSFAGVTLVAVAVALAPAVPAQAPVCAAWDVEYALAANLHLSDTPMGQGDGIYHIGPGKVVLRFEDHDGQPGGKVTMLSYEMREHFTITSKTLLWSTTVITEADTRGTPDACGAVAEGTLTGASLAWSTPLRGYRTDGTITCDGSLCGMFGAPPPGKSELHIGPGPVDFKPFVFAADMNTLTMADTFVSKTDMPKQTAHVALSGREMRRACLPSRPACP